MMPNPCTGFREQNEHPMRTFSYHRRCSSHPQSEAKASPREDSPTTWILFVAVILTGGLEARSAHRAVNERSAKEQLGCGALPPEGESVASRERAPRRVNHARTHGLSEALRAYWHRPVRARFLDSPRRVPSAGVARALLHPPGEFGVTVVAIRAAAAELPGTCGLAYADEPTWHLTIRSAQSTPVPIRSRAIECAGEASTYVPDCESRAGPYPGHGPCGNPRYPRDPRGSLAPASRSRGSASGMCSFDRAMRVARYREWIIRTVTSPSGLVAIAQVEFVWGLAGRFEMGALAADADCESDEGWHKVRITCADAGASRAAAPISEPMWLHRECIARRG